MADVKISGLPASTTPLAGTEVLPIVQGGQTRQVSINNLTTGKTVTALNLTLTGVATVPAGTVGAPSITTTGDTNTGIFFPAADTIAFGEGGVEAMRINSSGGVQTLNTISVGAATPSTSGAGITFPATASLSTNANTLDDYEEGTFTATFNIGGTANATRTAVYTKIGDIVYYSINFFVGTYTKSGTGNLTVTGLPFVSKTSYICMGEVGYFAGYNSATNGFPYLELASASQTLTLLRAGTDNYLNITDALFTTGTLLIRISGTYTAA